METNQRNLADYLKGKAEESLAERAEFAHEIGLDQKIDAIDTLVTAILKTYASQGIFDECECILCHADHKEAAEWVARKYKIGLEISFVLPKNEIFVMKRENIEPLVLSRIRFQREQKETERLNIKL